MKKIKPYISTKPVVDKHSGFTFYEAKLKLGLLEVTRYAVEESNAILRVWKDLENMLFNSVWVPSSTEDDPLVVLYMEQRTKQKQKMRRQLEENYQINQAGIDAELAKIANATMFPEGYDSRMDERYDHLLPTSKLPWWRRLFRV